MELRNSVFGSKEERRCFLKLVETWGERYDVYHNLPFLSLFKGRDSVSEQEYEFLKKSSVDYVICAKDGRPLVCIEFDGMQHGHNVGTQYHAGLKQRNRRSRKNNLDLKLRVAHQARFPFFVLSGNEFNNFGNGLRLSLVDAIIGDVFASTDRLKLFGRGFDPEEYGYTVDEFAALPAHEQFEQIEDWAIGVEVRADFENNPIFRQVAKLEEAVGARSWSYWFPCDDERSPDDWVLVESTVTDRYGEIASTRVRIPNFQTPGCEFAVHIALEIGRLVCLEILRTRAGRSGNDPHPQSS